MTSHNNQPIRLSLWLRAALLLLVPVVGYGQTAISGWTLSNANAANSSAYGTYNFDDQVNTVSSLTVGSTTKTIATNADNVYVRRSAAAGGNANVWEVATSASNLVGGNTGSSTLEDLLLSNNALMGVNDLFTNTGGTPAAIANNNIERVDYLWNGGFTAISDQGFSIFDRAANHDAADGFQIAVITGWNAITSQATSYGGNVVEITAGAGSQYGAALDYDPLTAGSQTSFTYQILRFQGGGDSLASLTSADATNSQGVFGVYISFADLGIPQGTTVYGYSIMGNDVTNVTANLVDWNNATYYPTTTPDSTGSIDLLAVNGKRWVPEPSTYGAMFLGLGSLLLGFRRWRQTRLAFSAPVV